MSVPCKWLSVLSAVQAVLWSCRTTRWRHEDISTICQHLSLLLHWISSRTETEPSPSPSLLSFRSISKNYHHAVVTDFNKKKQSSKDWTSPPYYTHIGSRVLGSVSRCTPAVMPEVTVVKRYSCIDQSLLISWKENMTDYRDSYTPPMELIPSQ